MHILYPACHTVPRSGVRLPTIDTLVSVPVRELWPNEASDFTPWLHDNPEILGDLLGTELFPQDREATVGRYSADLLFRDSSDRVVVVENLFGATDHDHLGKLITYSAGLGAGVAVLLAEEFRDEHRSALDWLNHISQDDFVFFGVILEAWRIGHSNPAPRLRVDTQPDNWSRAVRSTAAHDSPTAQAYRRFWGLFLPRLHEADGARPKWNRVSTPSKIHYMSFGSARSDLLRYNPAFCALPRRGCRIEAYLDSTLVDPAEVFDWLHERRDDIDGAIDQPVEWDRMDGKRACRISAYFPEEVRVGDEDRWPELVDWMVPTLCRLKDAMDPAIESYPQS